VHKWSGSILPPCWQREAFDTLWFRLSKVSMRKLSVASHVLPKEGQMRLTRPNVARLAVPSGRTEIIVFDEVLPGFGVRVRLGGKRTWIAQYRLGSKQRRITLGTTDTLDCEEARRRAKSVLGAVHNGDDPQARRAEARARASITLGTVTANYLERFAVERLRPKTLAETRSLSAGSLFTGWGSTPLTAE
jgi:hypothetical protein